MTSDVMDAVIKRVSVDERNSVTAADSVIVAIGKDGNVGKPTWLSRNEFLYFRVTNNRDKSARAQRTLRGVRVRDPKTRISVLVELTYSASCLPGHEERLAMAVARQVRSQRVRTEERSIQSVVDERAEDWLQTAIQDEDNGFLTALVRGSSPKRTLEAMTRLASSGFDLVFAATVVLSQRDGLEPLPCDAVQVDVIPAHSAKNAVRVTVRATLAPFVEDQVRAFACIDESPSFQEIIRRQTIATIQEVVSMDDLFATPPTVARQVITDAINASLNERAWRIQSLDVTAAGLGDVVQSAKVDAPFTFRLRRLDGEWRGAANFLLKLENRGKYHDSGIASITDWARDRAANIATYTLSACDYEEILKRYRDTKDQIERELHAELRDNGYALTGFNLTTTLPPETLAGVIRAPEGPAEPVEFGTNNPNCPNVKLTYYFDYQLTNLTKVRDAKEDFKATIADEIRSALTDEMHRVNPLDFYLSFDVDRNGNEAVQSRLYSAVERKLAEYGARIRGHLLQRQRDEVFDVVMALMKPARQGDIPPFEVRHRDLEQPVAIQTLVFRFEGFSPANFQQFAIIRPTISDIASSVRTHVAQWLADGEPDVFFRMKDSHLRRLFQDYVRPLIDAEFGVYIRVDNLILNAHSEIRAPRPITADIGEQRDRARRVRDELDGLIHEAILSDAQERLTSLRAHKSELDQQIRDFDAELAKAATTQKQLNRGANIERLQLEARREPSETGE